MSVILSALGPTDTTVLEFDGSLSESRELRNEVPEMEVETGTTITDNVVVKLDSTSIKGLFTDLPIRSTATSNDPAVGAGRSAALMQRLEVWRASAQLLSAQLPDGRILSPVVIEQLHETHSTDTGRALEFELQLKEVRFATTRTVAYRAGKGKVHKGIVAPPLATAQPPKRGSLADFDENPGLAQKVLGNNKATLWLDKVADSALSIFSMDRASQGGGSSDSVVLGNQ